MTSDARAGESRPRIDTLATRVRILRVAEKLFSHRGIDAVSLQEIGREAEQKNRSAVQYHFADKEGLLLAILDRHTPAISEHRNQLLDEIEEAGESGDLRRLAEAFVLPVTREARDPDGGLEFVRISAQLIGHPQYNLFRLDEVRGQADSQRIRRLAEAAAPWSRPELILPLWISATGLVFHGIADWANVAGSHSITEDTEQWDAFVAHIVAAVGAVFEIATGSRS